MFLRANLLFNLYPPGTKSELSLCHQYRVRLACTSAQSLLADQLDIHNLTCPKFKMGSSKYGRQTSPFRKFTRLRLKYDSHDFFSKNKVSQTLKFDNDAPAFELSIVSTTYQTLNLVLLHRKPGRNIYIIQPQNQHC